MSFSILKTFLRLIAYHHKSQSRQDHLMVAENLEYQLLLWVLLQNDINTSIQLPRQ